MKFKLTEYLIEILKADEERLKKMDIDRVAKHYGLDRETVEAYRNQQILLK